MRDRWGQGDKGRGLSGWVTETPVILCISDAQVMFFYDLLLSELLWDPTHRPDSQKNIFNDLKPTQPAMLVISSLVGALCHFLTYPDFPFNEIF